MTHDTIPTAEQLGSLDGCVALQSLFQGSLLNVRHWRCLHDTWTLQRERCYAGDVLTLIDVGCFVIHGSAGSAVIDPTCLVLQPARVPYRTTHPFGCGDSGSQIVLRPGLLRERLAETGQERRITAMELARLGKGRSAMALPQRMILHRLRRGFAVDPLAVEESMVTLLDEMLTSDERAVEDARMRPSTRRWHRRIVATVQALLGNRFSEPLQLDDLATSAGTSPFHLCRVFKSQTGWTIHQYRSRLRLLHSLEELVDTDCDLGELAIRLGFANHSHFSSAFRGTFAMTPSEFRRFATVEQVLDARRRLEES